MRNGKGCRKPQRCIDVYIQRMPAAVKGAAENIVIVVGVAGTIAEHGCYGNIICQFKILSGIGCAAAVNGTAQCVPIR